METDPNNGLRDEDLADAARLADGTLPDERRAEVEARVAGSPQLASVVEAQRVALRALQSTAEVGAPARLRAGVDRRRGAGRSERARRRPALLGGAIAATAVVILALVLALPGAFTSDPSVGTTAALAQKPPARPAPRPVPGTPQLLDAKVDDVSFPNYAAKFGWKPTGARDDDPSGRGTKTVYYAKDGRSIAYTIVSGDALEPPDDARTTERGGVEYHAFRDGDRAAVTWERGGQTCVLSGRGVRPDELVALADWRGKGAISF
jgi:anti-sigma factor RsiW